MESWQVQHREVILQVLSVLKLSARPYLLKGGTSLMLAYGLERFSEDIDLDQPEGAVDFFDLMEYVSEHYGYKIRVGKDTNTVKRCFIRYSEEHPLKVEVSMRQSYVPESEYSLQDFGYVYNIDVLARQKSSAYSSRDKIRDAYDVCFISLTYGDQLDEVTRSCIVNALLSKGFEQADYLVHNQPDTLVDNEKFMNMFLETWDYFGLLH